MGILSSLSKSIKVFVEDINTPESYKIGQKFEEYVREYIFTDKYFQLIEKTHDYQTNNKDYVEASMKPDFKFRDRLTKKEFYVEAKFRGGLYNNKITWCNDTQLARYQKFNKELPVFIIIGIGGEPKYPEDVVLIPLSVAKYSGLFPSVAEKFLIEQDKAITSPMLWKL